MIKGIQENHGAIKFEVVQELPITEIKTDTIYLVPITPDTQGNNYAEYIYVNGQWELLGKIGVQVDLANYQIKIDSSNKLSSDLVDDIDKTNKFVTASDKTNWNGKLDANKVKNANSTTAGDVYDVRYINTMIGDIESLLAEV